MKDFDRFFQFLKRSSDLTDAIIYRFKLCISGSTNNNQSIVSLSSSLTPSQKSRWQRLIRDGNELKKKLAEKQSKEWVRKTRMIVRTNSAKSPITKRLYKLYKKPE